MNVALFFFPPRFGAGSTTFTAHLHAGLRAAEHTPKIYRIMDTAQPGSKPFGGYAGLSYQVITVADAKKIVRAAPSLMVASSKPPHIRDGIIQDLLALGMRPVVHHDKDAADFDWSRTTRPICIRQAITALIPGSVYIPHPYVRAATPGASRPRRAVSTARVAASKRASILLEANRLLPASGPRIEIIGVEDRMYSKALKTTYPEFTRSLTPYHLDFDSAVAELSGAELNVDMSYFRNDGGGTQYVQLEAMDAGVVNVMHVDWFRFDGDLKAGQHVVAVDGAAALAALVAAGPAGVDSAAINANCAALLTAHDAEAIAKVYMDELLRGA